MKSLHFTLTIPLVCLCLLTGCGASNDPIGEPDAKAEKPKPETPPNPTKPPNPNKPPKEEPPPTEPPTEDPPAPALLAWQLSGLLSDQGLLNGTFVYDAAKAPTLIEGDAYYDLTEWQLTVAPTVIHPGYSFTKTGAQTASLCVGVCVQHTLRGTTKVEHLVFDNGSQRIQLEWFLADGVTLPQTPEEWGGIYLPGCWLRWRYVPNVTNDYVLFQTVAVAAVVDEGS